MPASFVWIDGYELHCFDGANEEIVFDFPSYPESFILLKDKILYTSSSNGSSQIFCVTYDSLMNGWGSEICLTEQSNYIQNISATDYKGKNVSVMVEKNVTIKENEIVDKCNLDWAFMLQEKLL